MQQVTAVVFRLGTLPGEDDQSLAEATDRLRRYLTALDVAPVGALTRPGVPGDPAPRAGTKGDGLMAALSVAGSLLMHVESIDALRELLLAMARRPTDDGREVDVTIADRRLVLRRATAEQQERLVDAYLASLPARS